jgi:steroid delta-isomerase-like uncharacterized protein
MTPRSHHVSTDQTAHNKATLRRFEDALGSGNEELISMMLDEIVAPGAVISTPLPVEGSGAEKLKEIVTRLRRAFPDLHVTVEDVIAEGDRVVARNTVTGTHLGEYMGIPPTGKSVTYDEIFIARFVDGRIAETRGLVDVLSQMKQLGALA